LAQSANAEKSAAETKLNKVKASNTGGIANASETLDYINAGDSVTDGDAENLEILKNIFENSNNDKVRALISHSDDYNIWFKRMANMTAEEKSLFYHALKEATAQDGWNTSSKSELNKKVRKILDDEDFAGAVADYDTANKTGSTAKVAKSVSQNSYSKSTSIS